MLSSAEKSEWTPQGSMDAHFGIARAWPLAMGPSKRNQESETDHAAAAGQGEGSHRYQGTSSCAEGKG